MTDAEALARLVAWAKGADRARTFRVCYLARADMYDVDISDGPRHFSFTPSLDTLSAAVDRALEGRE
jgi:6-phosphogluconolactonase (cycloisomerase 2 family)